MHLGGSAHFIYSSTVTAYMVQISYEIRRYVSARRLEIHIQSIHRSCRMCGKNFEATRSCRTHESVPHTVVCELCNKAFIQK